MTTAKMTSRERVLATIRHQEPDQVPVDFGSMRSSGIVAAAYGPLKAHLARTDDPRYAEGCVDVFDVRQQLAVVERPIAERFGSAVLPLDPEQLGEWQPYTLSNGLQARTPAHYKFQPAEDGSLYWLEGGKRVAQRPPGGLYFDYIDYPLAEATTVADIAAYDFNMWSDATIARMAVAGRELRAETNKAIMGRFSGSIYERGQKLRGFEQFMVDLADGGPFLDALLTRMADAHIDALERYLGQLGDVIDLIQMSDDLGTQEALQISPAMYRRWIKPQHKRIYSFVRERYPHVHVFLHSCGAIRPLIPDLIDAGVEVLNPVQTSAKGMDPATLKREYGKDLTFWGGGAETTSTLIHGSAAEIGAEVRERIAIFAPGGGFVFNPVHNIQADVPPENIVAVYDAAQRYIRNGWTRTQ
jgi:uroporphyrinogen decarboxylase